MSISKRFLKFIDKRKRLLFTLFFSALTIRIIFLLVFGEFQEPQMYEHGMIARNLYEGHGFSMHWPFAPESSEKLEIINQPPKYEGAFIPPLNPYIIYYAFQLLGDNQYSYFFLMLLNALFSSFASIYVFKTAEFLKNRKAAAISGIISVLFFPSVFGIITFSGSSLYQLLAILYIYFTIYSIKSAKLKYYIISGLTGGFLTLVRSEFLAIGLAIFCISILWMLYRRKLFQLRKGLIYTAFAMIIFSTVASPWIYRNTKLFGKFTTIVSHPWHEIWRGNNYKLYTNFDSKKGGVWIKKENFKSLIDTLDKLPYNQNYELAVDSVLKTEVLAYWKKNPVKAIYNAVQRTVFLWTIDIYHSRARHPLNIFFVFVSVVSFFAGIKYLFEFEKQTNDHSMSLVLFSFFILYTGLFTIVNLEPRYQVYLLSISHILSGYGILRIWNWYQSRRKSKFS